MHKTYTMCTVSFIPLNGKFFITSNSDEKLNQEKCSCSGHVYV